MTANDLSAFEHTPHRGPPEVHVHCVQSTMLTDDTRTRGQPKKARTATPLSGASQPPSSITQTFDSLLPSPGTYHSLRTLVDAPPRKVRCRPSSAHRAQSFGSVTRRDHLARHLNFLTALLIQCASLLTVSRTLNFLFKVLFIFPSRYLFAIGLVPIFSFRRSLPPFLG